MSLAQNSQDCENLPMSPFLCMRKWQGMKGEGPDKDPK